MPVQTPRDKAGIIQAFEFTFELFWKTLQKLAPEVGLRADSPRAALQAGRALGLITDAEAPIWSRMLRDRNLTGHVYRADVADAVYERTVSQYADCFATTLKRLSAELAR